VTGAPPLSAFTGPPNVGDVSPFRTLVPESNSLAINGVLTHPMGNGVSATVNGTAEWSQSEALQGLASSSLTVPAGNPFSPFAGPVEVQRYSLGATGPLMRRGESLSGHLSGALIGATHGWNWTLTGSADRSQVESITDRGVDVSALQARVEANDPTVNPFAEPSPALLGWRAPDTAKSVVTTAQLEATANGRLASLPAGGMMGSFTAGLATDRLSSDSFRSGVTRSADLGRDTARLAGNLVLPVASVGKGVLEPLGDLSVNLNAEADHYSDFGDQKTLGGGIRWSPWDPLRIIASYTHDEGAPSIQQLGNPVVATEGVRVFDFTTGQTVEVTQITGGNPDLGGDTRRVWKLGLQLKPFEATDLSFRADYTRSEVRDEIAAFPAVTPEIEAAFPDRFRREGGRLVQVDVRPVNFLSHEKSELRWGFNYSKRLGPQRPPGGFGGQRRAAAQAPAPTPAERATPPTGRTTSAPAPAEQTRPGGRGDGGGFRGRGGGGGFRGGRGGFGAGSFRLSLFHTWRFQDEVTIRPGVPVLDFLNGSAAGNGGGTPEHQVDLQAAVVKSGLGARLNARWVSGTHVFGGTTGEDLSFSDLATVNLRLFADLGQRPLARQHPFFRGARVTLTFDNLFDQRVRVRDAAGITPVSYQPDLLDPLGRTVRISFRKVFF
jgi:hypothetical protein